jgi:serine/threonine-protein kinase RsbW
MPETPEVISIRMPSRLELLGVIDRVAQSLCDRMEFDPDTASQVTMAVIEAGTNAIQHGHGRDASKPVNVLFSVYPDRMEVEVTDTGAGFEEEEVSGDVTSPEHLLDLRGRGIFIMRSCMDEVEFRFSKTGTVCHLVKHRHAARSSAG